MKALVVNCYQNNYYLSSLSEMDNLLSTLGIEVVDSYKCEVKEVTRATFISKGMVENCALQVLAKEIDVVVFNNDLSPLQVRNLTELLKCEVIDRSMVIIKIFEMRAKTREAKLQVEIASFKYNASRLVEKDSNFDQITSGSGNNRGSGEKLINLRRSQIREMISKKEKLLKTIQENRHINRIKRINSLPLVVITGYTNAGKSTLMNNFIRLTENKRKDLILQENRLFATLDTATRLIKIDGHCPFLLTDTVGFISNLPTHLIDSFRSTLEEIENADLVIEVIDASSQNAKIEQDVNGRIISKLTNAKKVKIYNKIDKIEGFLPMMDEDELMVSLNSLDYMDQILDLIDTNLNKFYLDVTLNIPYEDSDVFYEIKNSQAVLDYHETELGFSGTFKIYRSNFNKYQKYLKSF